MAMKFLTELRFCCRGCCTSKLPEDVKAGGSCTISAGRTTSSLILKRKTCRSPRSRTDMHWQPALSSIKEDGLVPLAVKGNGTQVVVSQKQSSPSSSSSNPRTIAKAHSFCYGDDEEGHYRKPSRFMVVPALSQLAATPFMF